jgi:hypothetical protein
MADAEVAPDASPKPTCFAISPKDRGQSCRLWSDGDDRNGDQIVVDTAATVPRPSHKYLIAHGDRVMARLAGTEGAVGRFEAEELNATGVRGEPAPVVQGQVSDVCRGLGAELPAAEAPRA